MAEKLQCKESTTKFIVNALVPNTDFQGEIYAEVESMSFPTCPNGVVWDLASNHWNTLLVHSFDASHDHWRDVAVPFSSALEVLIQELWPNVRWTKNNGVWWKVTVRRWARAVHGMITRSGVQFRREQYIWQVNLFWSLLKLLYFAAEM